MNHYFDALSGFTAEQIKWIELSSLIIGILVLTATLRLSARWCAGFTPTGGRTYGALIASFVLFALACAGLARVLGVKPDQIDPRLLPWAIPFLLLSQIVAYKFVLGKRGVSDVTFLQAVFTSILQAIFLFISLLALAMLGFVGLLYYKATHFVPKPLDVPSETPVTAEVRSTTPAPALPPGQFATVEDAQKEAVRRYPDLGVVGSPMNKAFVERYHTYQKSNPQFFYNISWPLQLADEVARDQGVK